MRKIFKTVFLFLVICLQLNSCKTLTSLNNNKPLFWEDFLEKVVASNNYTHMAEAISINGVIHFGAQKNQTKANQLAIKGCEERGGIACKITRTNNVSAYLRKDLLSPGVTFEL